MGIHFQLIHATSVTFGVRPFHTLATIGSVAATPSHQATGGRLEGRKLILQVYAKRKASSKQQKKVDRREDTREMDKIRQEREQRALELARLKPQPIPPPTTMAEADERLEAYTLATQEAVQQLKEIKQRVREDESYTEDTGYKVFPEVAEAFQKILYRRAAFDEARLERALLQMTEATGKLRSLESFNWRFGDGTRENAPCCEYMLKACEKDHLAEVASAVIATLEDAEALDVIDPKIMSMWNTPSAN